VSEQRPERFVAGEPIDVLRRALGRLGTRKTARGVALDAAIPSEEALPFMRALMRVEAELLVHDADHLIGPDAAPRSADERRADALVALVLRIEEAAGV
jgi:hypothetical protein